MASAEHRIRRKPTIIEIVGAIVEVEPHKELIQILRKRLVPLRGEELEEHGRSIGRHGVEIAAQEVDAGDGEEGDEGLEVAEEEGHRVRDAVCGVPAVSDDFLELAEDSGGEGLAGHGLVVGRVDRAAGRVAVAVEGVLVGEVAGFVEHVGGG